MKRILSILLVLLNLSLPKVSTCFAGGKQDSKVEIITSTVVEEKTESSENLEDKQDEKSEKGEKAENVVKNVKNTEKSKKESISLEISAETIKQIKKLLNSEINEKCTKTWLVIETIFNVLLCIN